MSYAIITALIFAVVAILVTAGGFIMDGRCNWPLLISMIYHGAALSLLRCWRFGASRNKDKSSFGKLVKMIPTRLASSELVSNQFR